MAWNMVVDSEAPAGTLPPATSDQLWSRLEAFLTELLPVAESAGVTLAAHPDDPPLPTVRGQPRLIHQPHLFQRLLDVSPSPANAIEFCVGTVAEMPEGDVYETTDALSRHGRIAYVHLRNVRGKAPHYHEQFVDDGDVDMPRILAILRANGFDGVVIPDHAPQMSCNAPWHAGMAYTLGYLQGCLANIR
jgi:mannonate dehydratase